MQCFFCTLGLSGIKKDSTLVISCLHYFVIKSIPTHTPVEFIHSFNAFFLRALNQLHTLSLAFVCIFVLIAFQSIGFQWSNSGQTMITFCEKKNYCDTTPPVVRHPLQKHNKRLVCPKEEDAWKHFKGKAWWIASQKLFLKQSSRLLVSWVNTQRS